MRVPRVGLAPLLLAAPLLTGVLPACNRTPPEPAQQLGAADPRTAGSSPAAVTTATTAAVPSASASAAAQRCVKAWSATPPPAAGPAPPGTCPPDADAMAKRAVGFKTTTLSLPEATGVRAVTVELAERPDQTERGLMFRTSLAEDRGMWFDLRSRRDQTFWMRNTCVPLDMVFVDEDGVVVGILEEVPVLNDEPRSVGCPSRYVLELKAGFARRNGLRPGQKLPIPHG